MKMDIEKRKIELQRIGDARLYEAAALELFIGESKTFTIKDLETYARLRVRLSRLKKAGRVYKTEQEGNKITIHRYNDLEPANAH